MVKWLQVEGEIGIKATCTSWCYFEPGHPKRSSREIVEMFLVCCKASSDLEKLKTTQWREHTICLLISQYHQVMQTSGGEAMQIAFFASKEDIGLNTWLISLSHPRSLSLFYTVDWPSLFSLISFSLPLTVRDDVVINALEPKKLIQL